MNKKEIKILNEDERGKIEQLINNVLRITSNDKAVRANHYHRQFGHWNLVTFGTIIYYERKFGSNRRPFRKCYFKDDLFWTPPNYEHCMRFSTYTRNEFYCFSDGDRNQKNYENDTIKLNYDLSEIYENWKD